MPLFANKATILQLPSPIEDNKGNFSWKSEYHIRLELYRYCYRTQSAWFNSRVWSSMQRIQRQDHHWLPASRRHAGHSRHKISAKRIPRFHRRCTGETLVSLTKHNWLTIISTRDREDNPGKIYVLAQGRLPSLNSSDYSSLPLKNRGLNILSPDDRPPRRLFTIGILE